MKWFPKKKAPAPMGSILQSTPRFSESGWCSEFYGLEEQMLYGQLRAAVPVIDAAIGKIVRLTGDFRLVCDSRRFQPQLDAFVREVPVGLTGQSLQCFADSYLDSLLTYGNALGEMLVDPRTGVLTGLQTAPPHCVHIRQGSSVSSREYWLMGESASEMQRIAHPERILFTALNPPAGQPYGISVLRGLPAISRILLRIYECIGQNYDRMGNVRYAVTYKPSGDPAERAYAGERTRQIAKEWSEGMRAGTHGEIRDFVCAGDVDIRVIGSDNALLDTEVPVRQLLEQLIAKLSIPPFLLGLNWSTTERMSTQQKAQRAREIAKKESEKLFIGSEAVHNPVKEFVPLKEVKVGQEVCIAELNQLATVLALPDKNGDVLVRAGIIKTKVPLKGLKQPEKLVKEKKPQTKAQQRYSRLTGDANRPNGRVERVQRSAKMECNLLGLTVDEALPEVDSFIDRAILNGQTVVYLIHGNGTGALRTAIHKHLRGNRMVKSFRLGRYGEGESGVTVVELK